MAIKIILTSNHQADSLGSELLHLLHHLSTLSLDVVPREVDILHLAFLLEELLQDLQHFGVDLVVFEVDLLGLGLAETFKQDSYSLRC